MPIDSSKFFDSIRIKPNKLSAKQQAQAREESAMCEWPECKNKGPHRAPKGRENSKEYWHFCLNHVREYNQGYNFFQGMNADAVARYQKDALTGHRPTWKRSEEHTSELQSRPHLVCRLLLEKTKKKKKEGKKEKKEKKEQQKK